MTQEVFFWIAGLTVVPGLVWATTVIWLLRDIRRITLELEMRMKEAEGKDNLTARALDRLSTGIEQLVHYIKWLAHHQTGEHPPPPVSSGK